MHGVWTVMVLIAFLFGMRQGSSKPDIGNDPVSGGGPAGGATRANLSGGETDGRPTRSASRENGARNPRDAGALEKLFGAPASAANLDLLAGQAMGDPNPLTRRLAFARLLESLTPENVESVREKLVALGVEGGEWRDFCYAFGAISGKAAVDLAANSPERDLAATLTGWAAANPDQASAMLANLPAELEGQRDELTASVVAGIAHMDPDRATTMVLDLARNGNGQAGQLMQVLADQTLRTQGAEGAAQWSETLPDGPLKGSAMSRIAEAYVRKNPQAAASWASRFASEEYAADAITRIGGRWAQSDPVAAVGWLEGLPPGSGQNAGLRNAFGDWEDRDPAAAGEYLLSMQPSAKRDAAISGFATGYAWQNPQLSITWAQEIQDPGLRQSSLRRAGEAYLRTDPAGARSWLANSGLPDDLQRSIIDSVRGGR